MSLSDLISFSLKLKGRGHFLSPKELNFLRELLGEFSAEEIKETLKRCYSEAIPPSERGRVPLTFCRKFFKKKREAATFNDKRNWKTSSVEEVLRELPPAVREKVKAELRRLKSSKNLSDGELRELLKLVIFKYLQ